SHHSHPNNSDREGERAMVHGNRDVRQDINDILATREELTAKVELLRSRIRGALWQTTHWTDEVKATAEHVLMVLNPSYRLRSHPLAMVAAIITRRYLLRQWLNTGS